METEENLLEKRVADLENKVAGLEAVVLGSDLLKDVVKPLESVDIPEHEEKPKRPAGRPPQVEVPDDVSDPASFVTIDDEWKLKIPPAYIDDGNRVEWGDSKWFSVPVYKYNDGDPILKMHLVSDVSEPKKDPITGKQIYFADRKNYIGINRTAIEAPDELVEARENGYAPF